MNSFSSLNNGSIVQQESILEKQNQQLNMFQQHAEMNPPEYPIKVTIIDNSKNAKYMRDNHIPYFDEQYFLTDINQNFIYANSFKNALMCVQNEIANPYSSIQNLSRKNGTYKIRLSSNNIISPPKTSNFKKIPNSIYKYWAINTTNAAASMFSNFRKSMRGVGGRKKKIKQ